MELCYLKRFYLSFMRCYQNFIRFYQSFKSSYIKVVWCFILRSSLLAIRNEIHIFIFNHIYIIYDILIALFTLNSHLVVDRFAGEVKLHSPPLEYMTLLLTGMFDCLGTLCGKVEVWDGRKGVQISSLNTGRNVLSQYR